MAEGWSKGNQKGGWNREQIFVFKVRLEKENFWLFMQGNYSCCMRTVINQSHESHLYEKLTFPLHIGFVDIIWWRIRIQDEGFLPQNHHWNQCKGCVHFLIQKLHASGSVRCPFTSLSKRKEEKMYRWCYERWNEIVKHFISDQNKCSSCPHSFKKILMTHRLHTESERTVLMFSFWGFLSTPRRTYIQRDCKAHSRPTLMTLMHEDRTGRGMGRKKRGRERSSKIERWITFTNTRYRESESGSCVDVCVFFYGGKKGSTFLFPSTPLSSHFFSFSV